LIENGGGLRQIHRVKFGKLFTLALAATLFFGCKKKETPETSPSPENFLPTRAQPKLPTMKIYLGAEILDTELAVTPEEEMTGMMFRTNIPESDSMLFVLPTPQHASFWMKNCPESLSAAYINPDGVIEEIHHLEENDTNPVVAVNGNIQFVLETKDGWFQRHHIGVGTEIRTETGTLAETFLQNR
jgi:uncharacterized protein